MLKEIREYLTMFDSSTISDIGNFLQMFIPDHEVTKDIDTIRFEIREARRKEAETASRRRARTVRRRSKTGYSKELPAMQPISLCSCGGLITGLPLGGRELTENKRVFYSECDTCDFWSELIKDGDSYKERGSLTGG